MIFSRIFAIIFLFVIASNVSIAQEKDTICAWYEYSFWPNKDSQVVTFHTKVKNYKYNKGPNYYNYSSMQHVIGWDTSLIRFQSLNRFVAIPGISKNNFLIKNEYLLFFWSDIGG